VQASLCFINYIVWGCFQLGTSQRRLLHTCYATFGRGCYHHCCNLLQRPERPFGTMVNYPNHGELSYDGGFGVDRRKQDIERLRRLAGEIVSICSNFSWRNLSGQGCFRRYKSIQIMVKVVMILFCDSAIARYTKAAFNKSRWTLNQQINFFHLEILQGTWIMHAMPNLMAISRGKRMINRTSGG
jgi:hypothetical protein